MKVDLKNTIDNGFEQSIFVSCVVSPFHYQTII